MSTDFPLFLAARRELCSLAKMPVGRTGMARLGGGMTRQENWTVQGNSVWVDMVAILALGLCHQRAEYGR